MYDFLVSCIIIVYICVLKSEVIQDCLVLQYLLRKGSKTNMLK